MGDDSNIILDQVVKCMPDCNENKIWGTNIYAGKSSVCSAAAHLGLSSLDSGGVFIIKAAACLDKYVGKSQNNIARGDISNTRTIQGAFTIARNSGNNG